MKVLFLVPYPVGEAASQRFRFEQYFSVLQKKGIHFSVHSFIDSKDWKIIYSFENEFKKTWIIIKGLTKRWLILFTALRYNYIFIHREATPIGPPWVEMIAGALLKRKIIYDFDDAIWLTDKKKESFPEKALRWRNKVRSVCNWSWKVSCGNEYLRQYAMQVNKNAVINPTTIDTEHLHNPAIYHDIAKEYDKVIISWTGSHTTLKYLSLVEKVLQKIEEKYDHVYLLVIADKRPSLNLKNLIFRPWSKDTEIKDLLLGDIGIMPLPDDEWAKGKCGFKALQYMALEIPPVISPVGVNTKIIHHGVNGYLCKTESEWLDTLDALIQSETMRKTMGAKARQTVIERYSVTSNAANFLSLFDIK